MRIAVLGAGVAGLVAAVRLTRGRPHRRRLRALARPRRPGGDARRRRRPPARALLPPPVHRPTATSPRSTTSSGCRTSWSGSTSSVAYFADGRQWPFVTPLDLLRFKPLPPLARVRMGAAVLAIQRGPATRRRSSASPRARGSSAAWARDAWRALWGPLLRGKFGERADDIAMVWLQNKLRLRRGDDARRGEARLPAALVGAAVRRAARRRSRPAAGAC